MFNNLDTLGPTDLREWITPGDREEIRRALRGMDLPTTRDPGTFDERALTVWRWVIDNITYSEDSEEQTLLDYWQFPAETIAIKKGDCEDCAFLLASLLLGSGISSYCVRVVIGTVTDTEDLVVPHAWAVYKDEAGKWCLLEATLPQGTIVDHMPSAESLARKNPGSPLYAPVLCINTEHVWQVGRKTRVGNVADFVKGHSNEKRGQRGQRSKIFSRSLSKQ